MPTHLIVSRRPTRAVPAPAPRDFDRLFDSFWRGLAGATAARSRFRAPAVDWIETDAGFRVSADLPGLEPSDVEVSLEGGMLTIRGERSETSEEAIRGLREGFRGRFQRSLRLPAEVDPEAVRAVYRNGVLTVTLPKAPAPEARTIEVTGPARREPAAGTETAGTER